MRLGQLAKLSISVICFYSGITKLFHCLFPRKGLIMLAYHRIADLAPDPLRLAISPADFRRHMEHIASDYHALSFSEALQHLSAETIAPNQVVVTFDDGYADNLNEALPILQAWSIPAMIFLTVGPIDREIDLWFERITASVMSTTAATLDLSEFNLGFWPLTDQSTRAHLVQTLIARSKAGSESEKEKLIAAVEKAVGTGAKPLMLTWEQIRSMQRQGIEFGCHTYSHPILSRLDEEALQREILSAKRRIEEELGESIFAFAYPNGGKEDYNENVVALLAAGQFRAACTMIPGVNRVENPFALKRLGIDRDYVGYHGWFTRALFAAEMSGLFDVLFLRLFRKKSFAY